VEFDYHRQKYYVIGKIFYWFVFIHCQIPYPTDINPAIVAYAIHGSIPPTILPQVDASIHLVVQQILSYNSRTSSNGISESVKEWLSIIGIPLPEFLIDLRDSQKGPRYVADLVATLATINNSLQAFKHFRDGFNNDRGFESV
jgi:hypothetical protein